MRLKSLIAVLIAACLVAAGAFLPEIVGTRLDRQNEDTVLFAPVNTVELEFSQAGLTVPQLLAIQVRAQDLVEVPPELASLGMAQLERIAATTVEKYREVTFYPETTADMLDIQYSYLVLCYGREGQNALYWHLGFGDKEGKQMYSLTVEDRTGTLCSIHYYAYEGEYHVEAMPEVLRVFSENFLTGLGEDFFDYDTAAIVAAAQSPGDRSYLASEITFEDALYGENSLTFFVNRGGFYTHFS